MPAAPAAAGHTDETRKQRMKRRSDPFSTLVERTGSPDYGVTLGGYGQHELTARDGENVQFRNHRFVVLLFARLHERISAATEIEFEWAGSPLKRDGVLGAGEVLLEFAVIDIEIFEWLVLRGGVLLMPVSSFNINHDDPTWDLVDRPLAYQTIVPGTWFETGAGFHGKFPLPNGMRLTYELYMVNGLDSRIADGFGMRGARGSHFEDNNSDKAFTGRVAFQPTLNSELGVSGYTGEYDNQDRRVNMVNLDFKLRIMPFEVIAEGVFAAIDPGYTQGFKAGSAANTRSAVPEGMRGFFVQTNFHFTIPPLWKLFPDDMREQATFTLALRYEGMDTDTKHYSQVGDQTRLTLGLNFRPIEQVVIKSDFQWNAYGSWTGDAPHFWSGDFWKNDSSGLSYLAAISYMF